MNCDIWEGSHGLFSIYKGIRASDIERNKISIRNKSSEERICSEHVNTSSKLYKTGKFFARFLYARFLLLGCCLCNLSHKISEFCGANCQNFLQKFLCRKCCFAVMTFFTRFDFDYISIIVQTLNSFICLDLV